MVGVIERLEPWGLDLLQWLASRARRTKFAVVLATDAALCIVSVWIAFYLRLGEWRLWNESVGYVIVATLFLWPPIFVSRGVYRSIVRYLGSRTLVGICWSCLLMMPALALMTLVLDVESIPRTIAVLHPIVFGALLITSRLVARYALFDLLNQRRNRDPQRRVLIYGAGSAGRQLAVSLRHEPAMVLRGYVDDDGGLVGKQLDGVKIYPASEVLRCVERFQVDTVILAMPALSRLRREEILHNVEGAKVDVLTLPAIQEIVNGKVSVNDLREVAVEDLLGRDPVPPDQLLLSRTVVGKCVMVTGAGGSIGSELARQICALLPAVVVLVEMTELALYEIETSLREAQADGNFPTYVVIVPELINVSDIGAMRQLMERWRPDTVFHAAAYKHVPLIEANAVAGMRNNIFGTLSAAVEAERVNVQHFILVSTDKAVRPTNVMGATKRVCEQILQAMAARGSKTRFTMVRFGNVLGSSGSVVPLFKRQIKLGGPITLTHREVTRYFMTIPEAAQLVIQAGAMAHGGEVFVLDMGEPVRVYDLARTMIMLSGRSVREAGTADGDIEIREVGLRPGEKLYEELLIGNEPRKTHHARIMQARELFIPWNELEPLLDTLKQLLVEGKREEALATLRLLVVDYQSRSDTEAPLRPQSF